MKRIFICQDGPKKDTCLMKLKDELNIINSKYQHQYYYSLEIEQKIIFRIHEKFIVILNRL